MVAERDSIGVGRQGSGGSLRCWTTAIEALLAAGRLREARALTSSVLAARPAPPAAARLHLTLAAIQFMDGHLAEALEEAEVVLDHECLPDELYITADVDRLIALVTLGELDRAQRWAQAILAGETPWGDQALAAAMYVVGLTEWNEGRLRGALRLLTAAAQRAELGSPELRRLDLHLGIAAVLAALGRFDEAHTRIRQAREGLEDGRCQTSAAGPAVVAAQVHLATGRLDQAEAAAWDGLDLSGQLGSKLFVPAAGWVLANVALRRGDLDGADGHLRRHEQDRHTNAGGLSTGAYLWTEAQVAAARGRRQRSMAILDEIVGNLDDHRRLLVDQPAAAGWIVRAARAAGRHDDARAVVLAAEHIAAANVGLPGVEALAAHARGLYDGDAAALLRAGEEFRHPWARGSALEDAGHAMRKDGEWRPATRRLQDAVVAYRRAGAERDVARVRRAIHDLRGQRARRARPATGWASLTDTERRVANLVAEGHTNAVAASQLFLSRHTVDFHLRRIFRKLAIRSRVELARIVVARHVDVRR